MYFTYISLSTAISLIQLFFGAQLAYKYIIKLVMKPNWFFENEDEEQGKE